MSYTPKSVYLNPNTSNTMTGNLNVVPTPGGDPNDGLWSISANSTASVWADATAGRNSNFEMRTGDTSTRLAITKTSSSESGSDAGSNLSLTTYTDGGSILANALQARRSDGEVYLSKDPTIASGISTWRYFTTRWPYPMWSGVVAWSWTGANGEYTWNITASTGFSGFYAMMLIPWGYPECMNFCVITNSMTAFKIRATNLLNNGMTYNPLHLMTSMFGQIPS